ncbi:hypothetical protein V5E97_13210 [Singulisphaera sp. Ch08]|uniref:Uncharacterized protein n=1 Tax=Singulisphaera sp. Ch08 TaxID=3120278 RepID=A0AAU7CPB1_9BACT
MTINPNDFSMSPDRFDEPFEPQKPRHGCFYYGCITAVVLAILMVVGISISGYLGYQAYLKIVNQFTSPTPTPLPKVEMSKEDRETLSRRIAAFKRALDQGEETEPLVLSGDELNVMLADKPELADRVYFVLEGDKLKGQVSLPLSELSLPGLKGRYLNGKAEFGASLQDGQLDIRADSIEVNGQPLSQQFMTRLRKVNLAKDSGNDPDNAKVLSQLESLQIKDGKVTIKAKPVNERINKPTQKEDSEDAPTPNPDEVPPNDPTRELKRTGASRPDGQRLEPTEKLEKPAGEEQPVEKLEKPETKPEEHAQPKP